MRMLMLAASGRRILYPFLMTMAGVVLSALVGLATISDKIPAEVSTIGLYVAAAICLEASVLVIGLASLEDLRELIRRRRLLEAVPSLATFRRFQCDLAVDVHGDGELRWTIEIEVDPMAPTRELRLPFSLEVPSESAIARSVTVRSLVVDGREYVRPGQDFFEALEVRRGVDSRRWVEFGVLRIPLAYGTSRQVAQVRMDLLRAFPHVADREGDTWEMDVGHLTDLVEVTIRPRTPNAYTVAIPAPLEEAIHCGPTYSAGALDFEETRRRSLDYHETSENGTTSLTWTGPRPKLGYFYRLRFRLLATERLHPPRPHRRRFLTRTGQDMNG
jgi:hypothetical protein